MEMDGICRCEAGFYGTNCTQQESSENATVVIEFGTSPLDDKDLDALILELCDLLNMESFDVRLVRDESGLVVSVDVNLWSGLAEELEMILEQGEHGKPVLKRANGVTLVRSGSGCWESPFWW